MKDNKVRITIRLDKDVVDWFKANHTKYQKAINKALVDHIMQNKHDATLLND